MSQMALGAARPPRQARAPSVRDQVHVEGVHVLRRQPRLQHLLRLHRRRLRRHEPQPSQHPVDVRVDGESGPAEREQQHHGRRLRPHAGQRPQPALRLLQRQVGEERQVERRRAAPGSPPASPGCGPPSSAPARPDGSPPRPAAARPPAPTASRRRRPLAGRRRGRSSRPTCSARGRRAPARPGGRVAAAAVARRIAPPAGSMISFGVIASKPVLHQHDSSMANDPCPPVRLLLSLRICAVYNRP